MQISNEQRNTAIGAGIGTLAGAGTGYVVGNKKALAGLTKKGLTQKVNQSKDAALEVISRDKYIASKQAKVKKQNLLSIEEEFLKEVKGKKGAARQAVIDKYTKIRCATARKAAEGTGAQRAAFWAERNNPKNVLEKVGKKAGEYYDTAMKASKQTKVKWMAGITAAGLAIGAAAGFVANKIANKDN